MSNQRSVIVMGRILIALLFIVSGFGKLAAPFRGLFEVVREIWTGR